MSDGDADEGSADEAVPDVEELESTLAAVREAVDALETELEAAETEPDLDEVEATLDDVRADHESIEVPEPPDEPEDEDEEVPEDPYEAVREERDDLGDAIDDVESGIEDQRGPYAEDVVDEYGSARSDLSSTRWTAEGVDQLRPVVATARDETIAALGAADEAIAPVEESAFDVSDVDPSDGAEDEGDSTAASDDPGAVRSVVDDRIEDAVADLAATVEDAEAEIDAADLDPDDDAGTIATLLEIADDLHDGVDDATAWDDLEVREQLRREGFYDVLDHVKDFPPEWHALKVHQQQGNVEQILLALDSLDSDYMEGHCFEALEHLADPAAIDAMVQRANRRDERAIRVLGAIGESTEDVVDTLLDYVDTGDVAMRTTTMRALGQLGAEAAVQPIADQLADENPTVRSRAARSLGLIGDTRTIAPLADVLAGDETDSVRASAAWALRQIGTEDALEAVTPYADDRVYLVQAEAERAR
ncbi:HEAT repeat domain-containing protein [Halovivax cerinus]|uniref:HEAT repeat domain-containing protein n=1 Tax=Halovivax cerinus TaxID=1487865 RepID=A0ABD5NK60_9EURY|nr:HEAT repeat domain-containing protein [Halovivax cerinus]